MLSHHPCAFHANFRVVESKKEQETGSEVTKRRYVCPVFCGKNATAGIAAQRVTLSARSPQGDFCYRRKDLMATKEELTAQAIDKAHKLELELSVTKQTLSVLETQVADLKKSDLEHRELLHSSRTIKWIFQVCIVPLAIILFASSIGALVWSGKLDNRVETLDHKLKKTEERLEATRDRIIIRQLESKGTFVKVAEERIFVKDGDKEFSYPLLPSTLIFVNNELGKLSDLREGMFLRISLGESIDGRTFALLVRAADEKEDFNGPPRPKKKT
jgi:hypothetical protein